MYHSHLFKIGNRYIHTIYDIRHTIYLVVTIECSWKSKEWLSGEEMQRRSNDTQYLYLVLQFVGQVHRQTDSLLLLSLDNNTRLLDDEAKLHCNTLYNSFFSQVLFLPLSNTIVTCFKDDSLFVWDSETLKRKFQLPVPPQESKQHHYRALATPRDGRFLVAGGR